MLEVVQAGERGGTLTTGRSFGCSGSQGLPYPKGYMGSLFPKGMVNRQDALGIQRIGTVYGTDSNTEFSIHTFQLQCHLSNESTTPGPL